MILPLLLFFGRTEMDTYKTCGITPEEARARVRDNILSAESIMVMKILKEEYGTQNT